MDQAGKAPLHAGFFLAYPSGEWYHAVFQARQRKFLYTVQMYMTLEKILQSQGFGSRKYCRTLILDHRVSIHGKPCTDPNASFETTGLVFSLEDRNWTYRDKLYLALHKPAGYECSHQPQHHPSVFSLLPQPFIRRGLQCVGRLDQDTTGLLLLSDDGNFIHRYTSPRKNIPKTYHVTTVHPVDDGLISRLKNGVTLRDENIVTRALHCQANTHRQVTLVIAEGKYHQVKRMIAAAGNRVENLHRAAIGGFSLDVSLPVGHWRFLDETDLASLDTPGTM